MKNKNIYGSRLDRKKRLSRTGEKIRMDNALEAIEKARQESKDDDFLVWSNVVPGIFVVFLIVSLFVCLYMELMP